ncbi:MAG: class I SAM-dependent methyltransferase [Proteobacteria bacterium]|jgi:methyltransferase (TIGR00027 family)|nr:class I SAM-dependent methyltransferase [Pseudomonadota bacterium]
MKPDRASHTAEGAAAMRAAGCYERRSSLRNPDTLAQRLVRRRYRILVKYRAMRWATLRLYSSKLPGMYEAHLSRTHHYDAIVQDELGDGADQYVVLGAGLDSRPYRLGLKRARVFEVDHPSTSAFKRQRLAAAKIDHSQVTFVEVDFEREDLADRLLARGFDPSKRTLVTWEGVTMYLDRDSVGHVLAWVASLGQGSSIVFDYVYPAFYEDPDRYRYARRHLEYVARAGEPYKFGLGFEAVSDFVGTYGLELVSNHSASDLDNAYLAGHRGKTTPWYSVARARTAKID